MSESKEQLAGLSPQEQRTLLAEMLRKKAGKPRLSSLSFTQERLWFLEQLIPESTSNLTQVVRLVGQLDVGALKRSVNEIVRRHEILRTTLITIDGQPAQAIAPALSVPLPVVELCHLPATAREAETRRLISAETRHCFNLVQGPLFRASLIKLDDQEHVMLLNVHHIVCDGWSMGILVRELVTLYRTFSTGGVSPLPDLPLQYVDFVHWQREQLKSGALDAQLAYWKRQLGDAPAILELPTDRPRPPVPTLYSGNQLLAFSKSLSDALKALSRQEGVTLFMTLLAAFQVLFYRYSGQKDICVGTIIANRNHSQLEGLIGFFTNMLALRTDLSGNPTFRELLRRVSAVTLEAYAHQDLPFDKVLEMLRPVRDLSHTPLYQVMLVLQNMPIPALDLPGLTVELLRTDRDPVADSDLTLFLWDRDEGVSGSVEYNADLFDAPTVRRMMDHFQHVLAEAVATPDERIATLPLMTAQEFHHLTVNLNQARVDLPAEATIQELFAAQVARSPDAIAVSYAGETLTFAELDARANQVARYLRGRGVGPEVLVGIAMPRSLEMIVAVLGVLKAGGAYLPLDPDYPAERLRFMINVAQIEILLTQERLASDLPGHDARVVVVDGAARAAIAQESVASLDDIAGPGHLAYVIYTSGSTGQPKGVMVTQQSLVNAYQAWKDVYQLGREDCHLQMASFSFDVFTGDLVRALCSGAKLVLCPRELLLEPAQLYDLVCREKVDCGEFVPVVVRMLVQHLQETGQSLDFMRLLIVGAESWYVREYHCAQTLGSSRTRLINSYGLSEATIDSSYFESTEIGLTADEPVPIGRPFPNTEIYLLDGYLRPVPVGVPGELYAGGAGLARGYLNSPKLTAQKFVPHPFSEQAGGRLYKTGDQARYLPGGDIQFLTRIDQQVKIRGFRVELGEIAAVLSECPAVQDAVALVRQDTPEDKRLVAYVVLNLSPDGRQPLAVAGELRAYLKERLPEYMLPSAFITLDTLPLTPNGKVDQRALPSPDLDALGREQDYVAPEGPLETKLAEIWSGVLGVAKIGVYDDFFGLGGHSLTATQTVHRINKALKLNLTVRHLFEEPTVAGLALLVEETLIDELDGVET